MADHIVITQDDPHSAIATSPQHPGFYLGRASTARLLADLDDELDAIGADPHRVTHTQVYAGRSENEQFCIRVTQPASARRLALWMSVIKECESGDEEWPTHLFRDAAGVALIIACEDEDTLGWVSDQMVDGDAVALVLSDENPEEGFRIRQLMPPTRGKQKILPHKTVTLDGDDPRTRLMTVRELMDSAPTYHYDDGRWDEPMRGTEHRERRYPTF